MLDSLWPHELLPTTFLCPWNFPGKNTGVGCHFLLQGIFPTQELNPISCISCRQILYYCTTNNANWAYPQACSMKHYSARLSKNNKIVLTQKCGEEKPSNALGSKRKFKKKSMERKTELRLFLWNRACLYLRKEVRKPMQSATVKIVAGKAMIGGSQSQKKSQGMNIEFKYLVVAQSLSCV